VAGNTIVLLWQAIRGVQENADFSVFVVNFLKLVAIREGDAVPLGHHAWENFGTGCSFWKRHHALVCVLVQRAAVSYDDLSCFFCKRRCFELV